MRSFRRHASLAFALSIVAAAPARADERCAAISIDGGADGAAVGELLREHGIAVGPRAEACRSALRLAIAVTPAGLRLEAVDATGRTRVIVVPNAGAAAILVMSWLDLDSAAPLLVVPLPPPSRGDGAGASLLVMVPPAAPSASLIARRAPASDPRLAVAAELGVSNTETRIAALRLLAERRLGPVSWGVQARVARAGPGAFSEGHMAAPTGLERELDRTELGAGARVAVARTLLGVRLAPSLGLGLVWQRHSSESLHQDSGIWRETVWTMAPRLELALEATVPLTRTTSLIIGAVGGGVGLARAPSLSQAHWAAPDEPRVDAGAFIGVSRALP